MRYCLAVLMTALTVPCAPMLPVVDSPTTPAATALLGPPRAALLTPPDPAPEPLGPVPYVAPPASPYAEQAALLVLGSEREAEARARARRAAERAAEQAAERERAEQAQAAEQERAAQADAVEAPVDEPDRPDRQLVESPSSPSNSWSVDWDALARCESGYGGEPNWSINTGNGYYGGLQFALESWRWVGGSGYPHEASKEEQIARAEILLQRQGLGAWPACTKKLGWR